MTSAQSMLATAKSPEARYPDRRLSTRWISAALIVVTTFNLSACESKQKLTTPTTLTAPYEHTQLWAVVPPINESGSTAPRTDRIADAFTEQAESVHGINTVAVNRVIMAMRRLGLNSVTTPGEANSLMNLLGVDGLIVGTVTAYDPYPPLKLGMAIQLFTREQSQSPQVDPVKLTRAPTEIPAPGAMNPLQPGAQASGIFDASNHQTLTWLNSFAGGRSQPQSAYGEDAYLVSMDLYTQFVAYRLILSLLSAEQARLMPVSADASSTTSR